MIHLLELADSLAREETPVSFFSIWGKDIRLRLALLLDPRTRQTSAMFPRDGCSARIPGVPV